jgi:hypothetical protein
MCVVEEEPRSFVMIYLRNNLAYQPDHFVATKPKISLDH